MPLSSRILNAFSVYSAPNVQREGRGDSSDDVSRYTLRGVLETRLLHHHVGREKSKYPDLLGPCRSPVCVND